MKKWAVVFAVVAIIGASIFVYRTRSAKFDLAAVDSNSNGVWDDLEPYIEKTAKTENQRKALIQLFLAQQRVLVNPEVGISLREGLTQEDFDARASACVDKVWGGFEFAPGTDSWRDVLLSNKGRMVAYIKYNSNLSGGVYGLWKEEEYGNPCDFEVSK